MNSIVKQAPSEQEPRSSSVFLPIALLVFLGFFSVGIPLAVFPAHVHGSLGFDNLWIGVVLGLQSAATLLTRHYSGTMADMSGAKQTALRGIATTVFAGLIAIGSTALSGASSLAVLMISRIVLGLGESLLITGCLAWGIGLLGPHRAGRVMAWSGIAMYAAIALAAPLGLLLVGHYGILLAIGAATLFPFIAGVIALFVPGTPALGKERMPFYRVVSKVWKSGAGLSLSAAGFATVAGFSVLMFQQRNWENAAFVMTVFGLSYIGARLLFGHTPDKFGGKIVAVFAVIVEIIGLALIWQAPSPMVAFLGAALTGFGYSLAFPAFGVIAMKNVDPQFKGVALGAYVAFFDLALGLTGPLAGLVANGFGYSAVYLFGMVSCAIAALIAITV